MLLLELAVEFLRDPFDIKGLLEPVGHLQKRDVAAFVEVFKIDCERRQLAQDEIARLAADVYVRPGNNFPVFAFRPIPEALRALRIHEDENVLVVKFGDFLVNGCAVGGVRDRAVIGLDFDYRDAGKLSHGAAAGGNAFGRYGECRSRRGMRPAEFFDKETAKLEILKARTCMVEV